MNLKSSQGRMIIRPYKKRHLNQMLSFLAGCILFYFAEIPARAAVIQAASCSYADVSVAVAAANAGDTVLVPAGTAMWNTPLVIIKGIILKGAGIDKTTIIGDITNQDGGMVVYSPVNPSANEPFRFTGFTLNANFKSNGIRINNYTSTKISNIRIDHNRIINSGGNNAGRCIFIAGTVYGVIDNNVIEPGGRKALDVYGVGEASWKKFTFNFGTADNLYYEDNIFNIIDTPNSGGDGGRYCARFNTYNSTASLWPWFDAHGNMGTGGNYSTMGVEIYGNVVTVDNPGHSEDVQIDIRGGKALVFNNITNANNGSGHIRVREEIDDALNPPATSPINGQPQHVSDSYFWENRENGTKLFNAIVSTEENFGNALAENREFYNQDISFNGTTGMGVGTLANRPVTCTPGVGYWAVDQGNWNSSGKGGQGIFYKCTAPNAWTAYFTPFFYPHPLRVSGLLADSETQTFSLSSGWNWISFNVLPADRSLNSVFSGILNQIEQVRTQTQSALRLNGQWVGDLPNMDGIQTGKMYKVRVNAACTLTVTGTRIASATPISMVAGWNWAAYYPVNPIPTGNALQSITSQVQQVRSQTQSAIYQNGQWIGDLLQMEPGKGYTIRMTGPGTLVYPGGQ